jgi:hypothetical protein
MRLAAMASPPPLWAEWGPLAAATRAQTRHKPSQAPRMACPAEVRAPGPNMLPIRCPPPP